MLRLLLASFLVFGFFASVADARSVQPPHVQGRVVFAIDHQHKIDLDKPTWHFEVRANGSWRYVELDDGRLVAKRTGKLSRAELQRIARLVRAPWNVSRADATCRAFAAEYTSYRVLGKAVWKDELCGGQILDAHSAKRLARVMAIVRPLLSASA